MARTYESIVSETGRSLLVVTFAELAFARKGIAEPETAAEIAADARRGHPSAVMAQALVTFAPAVAIDEWQRVDGKLSKTGRVLTGESGIDHVLHNFGMNNENRRIWLDKDKAAGLVFGDSRDGTDRPEIMSKAIGISKDRHIDMDLRRARVSANNFGASPSAKAREAAR